jgi:hypothetical protein
MDNEKLLFVREKIQKLEYEWRYFAGIMASKKSEIIKLTLHDNLISIV